jgi:hypothetical protein
MKHFLVATVVLFAPMPMTAQQVNNFAVCTQNQEVYRPGGYDRYGNYVPGGVSVQTYNVPCNRVNQSYVQPNQYYGGYGYYGRPTNPNCNPVRTALGATLGGAIGRAAAMNYPQNYGWATALGASLGGLTFAC